MKPILDTVLDEVGGQIAHLSDMRHEVGPATTAWHAQHQP
jgi:hypothetical protein